MILSCMIWRQHFETQRKRDADKKRKLTSDSSNSHQSQPGPIKRFANQGQNLLEYHYIQPQPSYQNPYRGMAQREPDLEQHYVDRTQEYPVNIRDTQGSINFEDSNSYLQIGQAEIDRKRGKSLTQKLSRIKQRRRNRSERRDVTNNNRQIIEICDEFDDLDVISEDQAQLEFQNLPGSKLKRQQTT